MPPLRVEILLGEFHTHPYLPEFGCGRCFLNRSDEKKTPSRFHPTKLPHPLPPICINWHWPQQRANTTVLTSCPKRGCIFVPCPPMPRETNINQANSSCLLCWIMTDAVLRAGPLLFCLERRGHGRVTLNGFSKSRGMNPKNQMRPSTPVSNPSLKQRENMPTKYPPCGLCWNNQRRFIET